MQSSDDDLTVAKKEGRSPKRPSLVSIYDNNLAINELYNAEQSARRLRAYSFF
jgi:hypothetical protein